MILEVRRYEIEPGRRDEFVRFFDEEVAPEMRACGMHIVGQFVSVEDDTTFVYLRAFESQEQRDRQSEAFYESSAWVERFRDRALEMETAWHVDVVVPTPGSAMA